MIDYDVPDDDPIVAEVRKAREEIGAAFNFDLRAICKEMQRQQATSGATYVTPPPRQEENVTRPTKKAG